MNKKKMLIRAARRSKSVKKESNPTAYRKALVNEGGQHSCRYCRPWKDDNKVARTPKRSPKKPKYKNKR